MKIDCCYECKERILGCHANCKKYISEKQKQAEEARQKQDKRSGDYILSHHRPFQNRFYATKGF